MSNAFNVDYVTPEELSAWIEEKKSFFLIHTLTGIHFQKVHLPGARNACVFEVSFLVAAFPKAKFTINGGKLAEEPRLSSPNYEVRGTLELRGVKADLAFAATIAPTDENGLVAEAHFGIDRTRWNVIYGSTRFFENLGMHLVFDLISFQLRIVARN